MLRLSLTLLLVLLGSPAMATDPVQMVIEQSRSIQVNPATGRVARQPKISATMRQKAADAVSRSQKILRHSIQSRQKAPRQELLIFLSESMPDHEIWRFLTGGIKLMRFWEVKFCMYGPPVKGVTDHYAETHQKNITLTIDPFLFETHQITAVPVVILGELRVDAPLNLSEALDLLATFEKKMDISKMRYELQLP